MLILIHGTNAKEKQKKNHNVLETLKQQKPNAVFSHLDFLDLNKQKFDELISTTGGLFEEKNIVLFSNIFRDKDLKNYFIKNLEKIENSENAFILNEDIISKVDLKKIEKHCFKKFFFESKKELEFNIFSLSDALQEKNKKNLWLKYHQALNSGLAEEQIFSNFFFSLKSLILTSKLSEKESGMNPYPYKKAKNNLSKWSNEDLENKIFNLISYYNSSRLNGLILKDGIEKFILEL